MFGDHIHHRSITSPRFIVQAINRSAVVERAKSIRAVLVLKDAKLDVGVSRGGSAIRDLA